MMRAVVLLVALGAAVPAFADQPCPPAAVWNQSTRHLAARDPTMKFALKTGTAVELTLFPSDQVKLAIMSEHKSKGATFAGLAAIDVSRPGTLDIALSTATYVDLIRNGRALKSTSFGRPANCPSAHKSVSFTVQAGRYVVQLIDAPDRSVRMALTLR